MKILLDSCISCQTRGFLSAYGFDVVWTGDFPSDPGDEEILSKARQEGRILITLDKDFGELVILKGMAHKGIIRLVNFRSTQQGPVSLQVLKQYRQELFQDAMITVEPNRVRIRIPESS